MNLRLTQTVKKGGCAAKVAAAELRKILQQVQFPTRHPEVLIDGATFDDAAVWKVSEDKAMVQTLDFFTPIVDSPRIFGRVAAANAISDVYAMGGTPKTALAILAFPLAEMPSEVITEVLQGACEVMEEAKVSLVGGHSIDDDTLKFGLSVSGEVHPNKIWSNQGLHAGQVLILTKALGTGTLSAALKRNEISEEGMSEALKSMSQVNQVLDLLGEVSVSAATDVTGFGLLGHSLNMALASNVDLEFSLSQIPRLEGAEKMLQAGFLTKAHSSNRLYTQDYVEWGKVSEIEKLLLFDPQTSGGLLLAVSENDAEMALPRLRQRFPHSAVVGRVLQKQEEKVRLLCS